MWTKRYTKNRPTRLEQCSETRGRITPRNSAGIRTGRAKRDQVPPSSMNTDLENLFWHTAPIMHYILQLSRRIGHFCIKFHRSVPILPTGRCDEVKNSESGTTILSAIGLVLLLSIFSSFLLNSASQRFSSLKNQKLAESEDRLQYGGIIETAGKLSPDFSYESFNTIKVCPFYAEACPPLVPSADTLACKGNTFVAPVLGSKVASGARVLVEPKDRFIDNILPDIRDFTPKEAYDYFSAPMLNSSSSRLAFLQKPSVRKDSFSVRVDVAAGRCRDNYLYTLRYTANKGANDNKPGVKLVSDIPYIAMPPRCLPIWQGGNQAPVSGGTLKLIVYGGGIFDKFEKLDGYSFSTVNYLYDRTSYAADLFSRRSKAANNIPNNPIAPPTVDPLVKPELELDLLKVKTSGTYSIVLPALANPCKSRPTYDYAFKISRTSPGYQPAHSFCYTSAGYERPYCPPPPPTPTPIPYYGGSGGGDQPAPTPNGTKTPKPTPSPTKKPKVDCGGKWFGEDTQGPYEATPYADGDVCSFQKTYVR